LKHRDIGWIDLKGKVDWREKGEREEEEEEERMAHGRSLDD